MTSNLEWNVFYYNINSQKIIELNIFEHGGFLKDVEISADFIPASEISTQIESLNNRLSDLTVDSSTATSADVVQALSTIVSRFGGNR